MSLNKEIESLEQSLISIEYRIEFEGRRGNLYNVEFLRHLSIERKKTIKRMNDEKKYREITK